MAIASNFIRAECIDVEGANLLEWLIGILAILITMLVGWQIYSVLKIDAVLRIV